MILVKEGVIFRRFLPEIYKTFPRLDQIFDEFEVDAVITSGEDGRHKLGSLHYAGRAVDLRSKHLTSENKQKALSKMKAILGPDYDILLEHEGKENEHFHLEHDPKG